MRACVLVLKTHDARLRHRLFYDQEAYEEYNEVELAASQLQHRVTKLYRNTVYRFQSDTR